YIVGRDTSDIEASARRYLPIIKAISDEAHKNNLPLAVHATQRITAKLAVKMDVTTWSIVLMMNY
ncbi:MAG: hypothetical protein IPN60_09495, partial [Saprospiraceae bacterium]|nr:hypothetical protein [Candidatus Opimibacter skivensis]